MLASRISECGYMINIYSKTYHLMNLLPGVDIGTDFKLVGKLFFLKVGTSIFNWEMIFFLIFRFFFVDLSIIDAKPTSFAFDFLTNFGQKRSGFLRFFDIFWAQNPFHDHPPAPTIGWHLPGWFLEQKMGKKNLCPQNRLCTTQWGCKSGSSQHDSKERGDWCLHPTCSQLCYFEKQVWRNWYTRIQE